jgi:hypothetical protein
MRLSLKGMMIAGGLLWGGGILFVLLINVVRPTYGVNFLQMLSSAYPWFHASRSLGDVMIGSIDALIDGGIAGLLFAWLYNVFAGGTKDA